MVWRYNSREAFFEPKRTTKENEMAIAATESSFDVAHWFVEYARGEDGYLQAQKLQRLLWLAQGEYARAYHGRKLMPTIFIAHELGPVEPNVYRAFELGHP